MMNKSFLHTLFLQRQRVFLRADLNVPLSKTGGIKSDQRLHAIIPTIKRIQEGGGKVILATHIGRPSGIGLEHHLSTRNLIPWFEEQGFLVDFESDLLSALAKTYNNPHRIMLLENLRFFAGEKEYSMPLAEMLSNLADIFVNDAFGTLHREDTSVALLPRLFLPQNRGWGLLVEEELTHLEPLHTGPKQPLVLVLGGAKVADKIPLLNNFLSHHAPHAIILGGKVALPFIAANGTNLGLSQPASSDIELAKQVLYHLKQTSLILPSDAVTTKNIGSCSNPITKDFSNLAPDDYIIDIGHKSITSFINQLKDSQTIFLNGTMGLNEQPAGARGTTEIIRAIAELPKCITIIGGGDAGAAVENAGVSEKITFISSGGGATLAYLGSENPWHELPGLKALEPQT